MGAILSKLGVGNEDWQRMPWRVWKSPLEQSRVLPTFVLCEWMYRAMSLATLVHAKKTNNLQLWFYSWMCGTANDTLFMFLPFVDTFWQAQACVMITPRLPLYIMEVYGVFTYVSITAARKFKLPYLQEAALTGLLAHFFYHIYDVNGPRFLWWTWHDGDQSVSPRQENCPTASSVWILTYCAIHAALSRWVNDPVANLEQALTPLLNKIVEVTSNNAIRTHALKLIGIIDKLHASLLKAPALAKIIFCGFACTPLFMSMMGMASLASFDKLGIPGFRTYRFLLLVYACGVFGPNVVEKKPLLPDVPVVNRSAADKPLFRYIVAYFVLQFGISLFGNPRKHISTGCHQICSDDQETGHDIMGWKRYEHMRSTGPFEHSRFDYKVIPSALDGKLDPAGRPLIVPNPDKSSINREWYTIVGVEHRNRFREIGRVALYCTLGLWAYRKAMHHSS
mmetsp:Transcript_10909/g.21360  ORF Transcript_10909/g.21360 Transcript_10909/m.21360 type:complete len:451 (+) Transcript_10909:110-1462(+)